MTEINPLTFEAWNLLASLIIVSMMAWKISSWLKNQLAARAIAANKLSEHYTLVERIADDPALPTSAVNFLQEFETILASKKLSAEMIEALCKNESSSSQSAPGPAVREVEALAKSRPDLADAFQMAVVTGVLAMILRTGPSLKKLEIFLASISDPKKEVQTVYRFVSSSRPSFTRAAAA